MSGYDWMKDVKALEREADALEAKAKAKRKQATDVFWKYGIPHTPQEIADAEQWLTDVEAMAGDGAAILDKDMNIIGRVAPVNGVVDLRRRR